MIKYQHATVEGHKVFYREAGSKTAPAILLLHGFPTSSHMFRNLIPALSDRYHMVAPDLPGFGFSDAPDRKQFRYTFENLAKTIDKFTQTNAENRAALREFLKPEATKWQYSYGVQDTTLLAPEAYELDSALLSRPGNDEIQLDLFLDYASNVALYPKFQAYFRTTRPPLLAVWGKSDPFFLPPGAEAFKRDNPEAEVRFFDTGHFALETHAQDIGAAINDFLGRKLARKISAA